ncbi:MAG: DUF1638 domain-containing protein [Ardenticatenaceae bacterium]|nr:DUF1638 domain-containing protein [Ardenticatenaceae bacterium]
MKTAFIICGALAREVLDISKKHGWEAEVFGIPAIVHMHPERIAPSVDKRIKEIKARFDRVIIVFGDCGSQGTLDWVLEKYGLERIDGPHCYEMYGGDTFHNLMDEEPGTFFLTDFLVRGFQGTIIKGLGLDRYPELQADYFRNYRRLVYLVQNRESELARKAEEIAHFLQLPLVIQETGYGLLEDRLVALMNGRSQPPSLVPRLPVREMLVKGETAVRPNRTQSRRKRGRD